jgi:hypothetical protein
LLLFGGEDPGNVKGDTKGVTPLGKEYVKEVHDNF